MEQGNLQADFARVDERTKQLELRSERIERKQDAILGKLDDLSRDWSKKVETSQAKVEGDIAKNYTLKVEFDNVKRLVNLSVFGIISGFIAMLFDILNK